MATRTTRTLPEAARRARLLLQIDAAWSAFTASYAGLTDDELMQPGVAGDWSVKDVLAHVTTWDAEALHHLPTVLAGRRPPHYAAIGGIDAFNARKSVEKRGLSLSEIRQQLDQTHSQLIDFLWGVPAEQLAGDTRFRRRLRLDTFGHYPLHTAAIREWRARTG